MFDINIKCDIMISLNKTLKQKGKMTITTSNDDFSIQLSEFEKIQDTCKKILQTKHYQALGEAGIHSIMARAKALGIHPFEALNGGFHCINGKVGMSTEMMSALIRQRGHSVTKDPKSNDEIVILHGKRSDNGDVWTCTFSKQDAINAGLWGTATWKKYPGVMLYNRCMSMLFRQLFSDLSLGAGYVEDELKEITKTGDYATSAPIYEAQVNVVQIEAPKISVITEEQALELNNLYAYCTEEGVKIISNILTEKKLKSLNDLPVTGFQYIKGILEKNQNKRFTEALAWEKPVDE